LPDPGRSFLEEDESKHHQAGQNSHDRENVEKGNDCVVQGSFCAGCRGMSRRLEADFRLFAIEIKWIATGEIRMEEATSWGSLSYIFRLAQRRPPFRQMTVGRLLAVIRVTVAEFS
jgi:hypothetical protein